MGKIKSDCLLFLATIIRLRESVIRRNFINVTLMTLSKSYYMHKAKYSIVDIILVWQLT